MIKKILFVFCFGLLTSINTIAQNPVLNEKKSFSFAFLTDIHLKPEMGAPVGFQMAIDKVNQLNPDFVLMGGDLVYDAMRGNQARCDTLFSMYKNMSANFKMPVYNCIGNHDLFAIYPESPESSDHPDYKYGMFERYFGDTFYSFDHEGWHFIVLNSLDVTADKKYKAVFNDEELLWLKNDLEKLDKKTPIVITTHIPMISTFSDVSGSEGKSNASNSADIIKMLENYNLKLILQGHIHWKEYGFVNDKFHYITGGSIAGNGWKGRRHNTKEGFVFINVKGDDFSWEYVDHGWEAERMKR